MAAVGLDVARLSAFCSLLPTTIESLLDTPTVDLVRTLLSNISERAQEFDEVKSEKLKLAVELENAVRGGESKSRFLKSSINQGLKEAADLKEKLQAAGTCEFWVRGGSFANMIYSRRIQAFTRKRIRSIQVF